MKTKLPLFELTSEDLTHLGGPMGSEYTTTNWRKFYTTVDKAKKAAEKNYGKPIEWKKSGKRITSGDLNYVMYDIFPVKVEA